MKTDFTQDELNEALRAIDSTIGKCEKVRPKLKRGTAQHTLLARRIKALQIAAALIKKESDRQALRSPSSVWRDTPYHKLLGRKAADEVERLLPVFEAGLPDDRRPRRAIEALRAWTDGTRTLGMAEVRKLSLDAHAAAKAAKTEAAQAVAHAAGQAIAAWHVPTHALAAFSYAGKARCMKKSKPSAIVRPNKI